MNFYETIKTINTTEDEEIKNELIGSLLETRKERNFKTGKEKDLQYIFTHSQLKSLMAKMEREFKKSKYISIHTSDIFTVILDTVYTLSDFNFEDSNEVRLMIYLEKKIRGRLINEYKKTNKLFIENQFFYESSEILERGDGEEKDGLEGYCNRSDWFRDLDELFDRAFNYQENFNKEFNWNCDESVYLSWFKFFWDPDYIMNKKLLNSNRKTKYQELMQELTMWRDWTTNKQKEKIEILLKSIENGENIFKYTKDNRYVLDLKKVGDILYPNRKGNCNKDIYNFIDSIKKRFTKYLANTNKSNSNNCKSVA